MIKRIYSLLDLNDKKTFFFLFLFSIFVALIETVGVAAIMPFISVASDFSLIHSNDYYQYFYDLLGFERDLEYVIVFGVVLIAFYIFRGFINLLYTYFLSKFSYERYHLFSSRLFENYLDMPYKNFIENNSSNLTKTIINEVQNLTAIISSLLLIVSELLILIMIYSVMLYVDWVIVLFLSIFLTVNGLFLLKVVSKRIKKEGSDREIFQKEFYEIINSTFGNFKIIKILSNNKNILSKFKSISSNFAISNIRADTLGSIPRILLETVGFVLVSVLIIYLVDKNSGNVSESISILSIFVLGLYRLMPSVNRIMSSYNIIQYNYRALDIIHDNLMNNGEDLGNKKIEFNKKITLNNLSFGYADNKEILTNIELTIEKGDKIAFIGPSGSGKSTIVDIIMGLYQQDKGAIFIDDNILNKLNIKSWRKKIGYIPQQVYLFDGTVAQNVSFGLNYNEVKIKEALEKAKILDFLVSDQNGIDTFVGEGGIKLSGGQKQRIAIARALYQKPEILVLDEATSALDESIEKEIMDEIYDICKDKTLIIIAHRLSTVNRCEKIYKIENKKIILKQGLT
jgi:ATP-binding cassette, subfamily B, bacterial PglK